ncbi:MAG: DUF2975 domain-containing protein [Lachnospiraceae bacterium]
MNHRFIKFTKLVLDIMFFGGVVIFISLPFLLKILGKYYSNVITDYYLLMIIVFGVSGIFGIIIISQLRQMMKTVIEESCFVNENVKSLNIMMAASFCIFIMFIIKLIILPTPATGIIALVFFIAALFSKVLAYVFAEAVRYKEENDFTI